MNVYGNLFQCCISEISTTEFGSLTGTKALPFNMEITTAPIPSVFIPGGGILRKYYKMTE